MESSSELKVYAEELKSGVSDWVLSTAVQGPECNRCNIGDEVMI